jgi:3-methyl-2-oxobutanoate hydroxymethyltransferase
MKLQAHHIRALKGQRQLVQINVSGAEQAEAAEAAGGIDIIVNGEAARWAEVRAAAPNTHLCLSLRHGEATSRSSVLTQAFAALEAGADSIYCSLSPWNAPSEVVHPLGYDYPVFRRTRGWLGSERSPRTSC